MREGGRVTRQISEDRQERKEERERICAFLPLWESDR